MIYILLMYWLHTKILNAPLKIKIIKNFLIFKLPKKKKKFDNI